MVDLAHARDIVPVVLEVLRERRPAAAALVEPKVGQRAERRAPQQVVDARRVGAAARQEAVPRRQAQRDLAVGLLEDDRLGGERVEVRREGAPLRGPVVPVRAEARARVIQEEVEHVALLRHGV